MPMPEGARSVLYSVNQYADASEVYIQVSFDMTTSSPPADVDLAAAAAMEAFVAKLTELHPEASVDATRAYVCRQPGDPWPPAPEGA